MQELIIISIGPSWFHGTASEHNIFYQYQLSNAQDIYLGHVQTETPYFQADPDATQPFEVGMWDSDPTFETCDSESYCKEAFALRVVSSSNILIYSAGFYSFYQAYDQGCLDDESCQEALVETSYTEGFWLYNIFTKGAAEIVTPQGGISPTLQSEVNQT